MFGAGMKPAKSRMIPSSKSGRRVYDIRYTEQLVSEMFIDLHTQRIKSLSNAVTGVLHAAQLTVHCIGQAYAAVAEMSPKHGVKQIDRLLSNTGLDLDYLMGGWIRYAVGNHETLTIALDWTIFDDDDHATLAAYMITNHGRAMPLAWRTVKQSELKEKQTGHEDALIQFLHEHLPGTTRVTLLADRGFGRQSLYSLLATLGWDYVIRFREGILVEDVHGTQRLASEWLHPKGIARKLAGARVTDERTEIGAVVVLKAARMKESWCLATSMRNAPAAAIAKLYGRRFTIEETFRDTKDLRFGLGLRATHIKRSDRRDRLLLLIAVAHTLLCLLGAAAEEAGLDRHLKANTVKRRTHSLYRQGAYWYGCIATMREEWFRPLVRTLDRIVRENAFLASFFGLPHDPAAYDQPAQK